MNYILLVLGLVLVLQIVLPAQAQSVLNITADKVVFDQSTQSSIYSGNVVLSDLENTVTAEQIESQKTKLGDEVVATGSPKHPAVYKNSTENLQISAQKIHYNQRTKTLVFSEGVVATNPNIRLEADYLTYYINSKKIISHAKAGRRISSVIKIDG